MFFNRRPDSPEFVSSVPDYDQDQDEYYGEEDGEEGDDEHDEEEEEDDEEEDEEGASAKPSGSKNWVKSALIGIAALLFLGGGGYYAMLVFAPEVVDEIVNSISSPEEAPADPVAQAPAPASEPAADPAKPDEAAPPPPSEPKQGGAPVKTAGKPAPGEGEAPPPNEAPPAGEGAPAAAPPADTAPAKPAPRPKPKPTFTIPPVPKADEEPKDIEPVEPVTRVLPKAAPRPTGGRAAAAIAGVPSRHGLQVGSFANPDNASRLVQQLRAQGRPAFVLRHAGMSRVYLGQPRLVAMQRAPGGRYARSQARAYRLSSRYAKKRMAQATRYARKAPGRGHWHARYTAPGYRSTPWIPGHSSYIPWGGGQGQPHSRRAHQRSARPQGGRYGVQVGSFSNPDNAALLVSQLRSQGIQSYTGHSAGMSRVYVGNYRNPSAAGAAARQLQGQGIPAAVTLH
ncbi:MAG: SPOR domain-containing protein [Candidatus Sericytochromatia bacterium]|nr:SPOR domain-containing protein [Candidatus Sericytochromatia bacterium]